ncbi:uncharacterized protein LOC128959440 [Oppia nitens]|uniref:uncharacterized protein LOC128959440 n=1 Tax=Oppia nitens TaxID=1686743 RepID=UPI0023DCD7C3|nr:uncharacterized protein LOC128959440 [Oppia nitens]
MTEDLKKVMNDHKSRQEKISDAGFQARHQAFNLTFNEFKTKRNEVIEQINKLKTEETRHIKDLIDLDNKTDERLIQMTNTETGRQSGHNVPDIERHYHDSRSSIVNSYYTEMEAELDQRVTNFKERIRRLDLNYGMDSMVGSGSGNQQQITALKNRQKELLELKFKNNEAFVQRMLNIKKAIEESYQEIETNNKNETEEIDRLYKKMRNKDQEERDETTKRLIQKLKNDEEKDEQQRQKKESDDRKQKKELDDKKQKKKKKEEEDKRKPKKGTEDKGNNEEN